MEDIITIDGAGRLVIPVHLRRKHHLISGSRLKLMEEGSRLVLEPLDEECPTAEKHGLLVLTGTLAGPEIDHRALREERLDQLTPRVMKVAFDTSVLVAGSVSSHPHHERALWWLADERDFERCASWHALAEIWSTLTRLPFRPPVPAGLARQVVLRLETRLILSAPTARTYREAIGRCSDRGLRSGVLFDALHLVAARQAHADLLLTFNSGDFERVSQPDDPRILVPPDPPGLPHEG